MSVIEPQQEQPQETRPRRKRAPLWVLLVAVVIPFAIIAGAMWFIWVTKPAQDQQAFSHEISLRTSGLSRPTVNKLDERFTDADNDLVADPPTDPSKFLD